MKPSSNGSLGFIGPAEKESHLECKTRFKATSFEVERTTQVEVFLVQLGFDRLLRCIINTIGCRESRAKRQRERERERERERKKEREREREREEERERKREKEREREIEEKNTFNKTEHTKKKKKKQQKKATTTTQSNQHRKQ